MSLPRPGCVVCGRPRGPRGGEMPIAAFAGTQPERRGTLASYGAAVKPRPRSLRSIFVSFRDISSKRDRFAPDWGAGRHKAGHSQRPVLQTPFFGLKSGFSGLLTAARSFIDLGSWN